MWVMHKYQKKIGLHRRKELRTAKSPVPIHSPAQTVSWPLTGLEDLISDDSPIMENPLFEKHSLLIAVSVIVNVTFKILFTRQHAQLMSLIS